MAQNNQQSSLQNICNVSVAGANLFQVSLVKQSDQQQSYKKQYFAFVQLSPGVKQQDGSRTFDMPNTIRLKTDLDKLAALKHALIQYALGNEKVVGKFSIFVDSSKSGYGNGGGAKSMTIARTIDNRNPNDPNPNIVLYFKSGQNNAIGFGMSCCHALGIADQIGEIVTLGTKLENSKTNVQAAAMSTPNNNYQPAESPPQFNQQQAPPQFNQQQAPPQFNGGPDFSGFNPDDDIPF